MGPLGLRFPHLGNGKSKCLHDAPFGFLKSDFLSEVSFRDANKVGSFPGEQVCLLITLEICQITLGSGLTPLPMCLGLDHV
jgi:hypothetical protein